MPTTQIRNRKHIIDRIDAKRTFVERFAAADHPARPNATVTSLAEPQEIVYYNPVQVVTGYGAVFGDPELVAATYDSHRLLRAKRIRSGPLTDAIVTPAGVALCQVRPLGNGEGVEFEDCLGAPIGRSIIEDSTLAIVLDRAGRSVAKCIYGPGCAVWISPSGESIGKARSNTVDGLWLATEDAWRFLVRLARVPLCQAS
jgi:hypothetical protein